MKKLIMKKLTAKRRKKIFEMLENSFVSAEKARYDTSERCYILRISDYDAIIQRERRNAKKEAAKAFLAMIDPGCKYCDEQQHEGCYCLSEKIKAKLKKYMEGI